MRRQHPLLQHAFRFRPEQVEPAPGCRYSREIGAWVAATDGELLVVPQPGKPRPKPMSKKADVETGEDMKGP